MSWKPMKALIVVGVIAGASFAGGYAVGHQRVFSWTVRQLSAETSGNLSYRVETLARLQTGDQEGAVELLEMSVDTAIMTLPQGKDWDQLPASVQDSLMLGKAYRTVFPSAGPTPELRAVLAEVPLPEPAYCSPALQELLTSANG